MIFLKPAARYGVESGMKRGDWRYVGILWLGLCAGSIGTGALAAEVSIVAQAQAAYWTGSYLKGDDSVRELALGGEPRAALTVLRAHEKAGEPRLRALALALQYEHAKRLGVDAATRERLHRELMAMAENAQAPGYVREEACRVLLDQEWSGRDAWYEKLLGDPTLRHPKDGVMGYSPLLRPLKRDPERWVPRLIPLLQQASELRANVAHLLAELSADEELPARRDVALALLPWLADRTWVADAAYSPSPRAEYISSLSRLDVKEAIPGLIRVLETEHGYIAARAAATLGHYRDARALPALRKGLDEHLGTEWEREAFTEAITACGGVKPAAGVAALEAYARLAATPAGLRKLRQAAGPQDGLDARVAQGLSLAYSGAGDDALVAAVLQRVAALRPREPKVALALEAPLFAWEAPAAQRHVVARLAAARLEDSLLHRAISERQALAAGFAQELRALLHRGGPAAGRAAAVLDEPEAIGSTLRGKDAAAILSLLHSAAVSDRRGLDESEDWNLVARGSREGSVLLPIDLVGPLLASPNPTVAAAAQARLEYEGGKLAQAWLQARGQRALLVTPPASHYSIGGVTPGMSRETAAREKRADASIQYASDGRVLRVSGRSLRDGEQELLSPARATAAEVRRLLGRPARESAGHVFATAGGFFWQYDHGGWVLIFAFSDDLFTLGERAPLFQITMQEKAPPPVHQPAP